MKEHKQHAVPAEQHAAEFLANERTFLAWVRTSIAVISLGCAVAKFDAWLEDVAVNSGTSGSHAVIAWRVPVGLAMIAFAGLLSIFAAWRYHAVNRRIESGTVRADRGLIVLVTALIVFLTVIFIYALEYGGKP